MQQENDIRYKYYWITVFNKKGYKDALMSLNKLGMLEPELVTVGRPTTHHRDIKEIFGANIPDISPFTIGFGQNKESEYVTHLMTCSAEEVEKITAFLKAGVSDDKPFELNPAGSEHMLHYTLACTAVRV